MELSLESTVREINSRPVYVMRILWVCDAVNACSFYRCRLPASSMLDTYPDFIRPVLRLNPSPQEIDDVDVVVLQRHTENHEEYLKYAKSKGKLVIYEHDDLDLHLPSTHSLYRGYKLSNKKEEIKRLAQSSDHVTLSTTRLAEEYRSLGCKSIKVFQNMLDLRVNAWNTEKIPPPNDDIVRIGWAGGSTHFEDLQMMSPFIVRLLKENPNVVFIMGGYNPRGVFTEYFKDDEGKWMQTIKHDTRSTPIEDINEEWERENGLMNVWYKMKDLFKDIPKEQFWLRNSRELEDYPEIFREFDITLAPIVDNPFARCKSHLKVLEGWGASTPVIASDVGEYHDTITHGVNGFLVRPKKPKEFYTYAKRLVEDKDLRISMGIEGRKELIEKWDLSTQVHRVFEWYYRKFLEHIGV